MTYKENAPTDIKLGAASEPPIMEHMTDTAQNALFLAADIRHMSRNLYRHLFGDANESCEKESEPTCLQESVAKTRSILAETAELLANISARVGV